MMGRLKSEQDQLFSSRRIDTALDLSWLRSELEYPLAEESINSRGK